MKRGRDAATLLAHERGLWELGYRLVGGMDEAGRGPLAGPVVSACVVFRPSVFIEGVYDSKALSPAKRQYLYEKILEQAAGHGIGTADNDTIDRINIYEATKLSMVRAVENLGVSAEFMLIDAMRPDIPVPSRSIIKGDQKSFTIAAASIIAKVHRDRLMVRLHEEYPQYGWKQNKGYPTREHREAVKKHGFSPYHRRTFKVR